MKGCTVKWINGKKFREVAKILKGWESTISGTSFEGIELPGAWEQTGVEEEEELFKVILVVQQEAMTQS